MVLAKSIFSKYEELQKEVTYLVFFSCLQFAHTWYSRPREPLVVLAEPQLQTWEGEAWGFWLSWCCFSLSASYLEITWEEVPGHFLYSISLCPASESVIYILLCVSQDGLVIQKPRKEVFAEKGVGNCIECCWRTEKSSLNLTAWGESWVIFGRWERHWLGGAKTLTGEELRRNKRAKITLVLLVLWYFLVLLL